MDAPARSPEYSADGAYVVAASGDRTARIWRDEDGEETKVLHPAPVTQATFRPVVRQDHLYNFVTTSTGGSVRLVRMQEAPIAREIYRARASPTGDEMFRTPTPKVNVLEPRHPGAVLGAKWSADGRWLATVGAGEAVLWQWTNDDLVPRLQIMGLNAATSHVEFSPDAQTPRDLRRRRPGVRLGPDETTARRNVATTERAGVQPGQARVCQDASPEGGWPMNRQKPG